MNAGNVGTKDPSNGYENIAAEFMRHREQSNIGISTVLNWARGFSQGAAILDVGCGSGLPVAATIRQAGLTVYGVDASATLAAAFKRHFPDSEVACESVEESSFFGRKFDGAVVIGLVFLLAPPAQSVLIRKLAFALNPNGRILLSAPKQACEWNDVLTNCKSCSLGEAEYRNIFQDSGLTVLACFEDEGGNYYYDACLKSS